ncbi:ATP-dependent sacrificial sulfur transferase LarE [Methanococcus voltae]|uniref:Queuosine synthesis-like protein n=1 Tax=Methanococcus voltae (strain ATCC BAA-1334 / A3) TaxID=456320 RepID=D7DRQ6_METV3|nr:ATP-dependent sacrificial sulfur transferase LarE [Methanococcus voltae]MCS3901134.1 uncharacterized protein [Methanococcus voltae]
MDKEKFKDIKNFFRGKKVIVSYSGGVDSTLVAKLAQNGEDCVAVTIDNGFFSKSSLKYAEKKAKLMNLKHVIIDVNQLDENVCVENRCYECKKMMAKILNEVKDQLEFDIIVDGTIYEDLSEDRPGLVAYRESGIISPLAKYKITKDDVNEFSYYLGLDIPKKETCIATRVLDSPITKEKMQMSKLAEDFIMNLLDITGYFRVRTLKDVAIIEVSANDAQKFLKTNIFKEIDTKLKELGYQRVMLDLSLK